MEFYINKNSNLPKLTLGLINDGRNDYHKFHEEIQNAEIYFTMTNIITGVKKIANKKADIELVQEDSCNGDEYFLVYNFTNKDTSIPGKYVGQFEIIFNGLNNKNLIVPIREELFINVLEGSIRK